MTDVLPKSPFVNTKLRQNLRETKVLNLWQLLCLRPPTFVNTAPGLDYDYDIALLDHGKEHVYQIWILTIYGYRDLAPAKWHQPEPTHLPSQPLDTVENNTCTAMSDYLVKTLRRAAI